IQPTIVADGRTPFQVFHDQRFLGNSRTAPCSAILKQRPSRAWLNEHADPANTVLYVGIDWSETRRTPAIIRGWTPWTVRFPMCDPPHLPKQDMLDWCTSLGITPPRLYRLGFSHITAAACASGVGRSIGCTCWRSSPTATPRPNETSSRYAPNS